MSPPGVLATLIAPRLVVQTGHRWPAVKRECPVPRHIAGPHGASHSRLTARPAPRPPTTRRGRVMGRAFGACCFAGKLRSPARPPGDGACLAQLPGLDPYVNGYVNPYVIPYALGCVPPASVAEAICAAQMPFGGMERPRRKERVARLIQRRGRALWPAIGRRRLGRQSQPDLVATYGGWKD
jgi:hypothetical protein